MSLVPPRKIIVNLATSADGYVARRDGSLDWLIERAEPGKNIWLMGGGDAIASFLDAGEIDEMILTVMPIFIGEGIPLLSPKHREIPLRLLGVQQFPDGVVQSQYSLNA